MSCFALTSVAKSPTMGLLDVNKLEQIDFPEKDYFKKETSKCQIVAHHTASGKGIEGDVRHWLKPGHIATPIIIGHNGIAYQLFSSRYWGYHLGIEGHVFTERNLPYKNLNKTSIGCEIDSWGPLKLINGEYRTWVNDWGESGKAVTVDPKDVVHYENGFRGYEHYQKYTPEQIDTFVMLAVYWCDRYDIPPYYNDDIWDVNACALSGDPGIYTHVSYREDKSDCHPQPDFIEGLKRIEKELKAYKRC